jgi:hypothetical protein
VEYHQISVKLQHIMTSSLPLLATLQSHAALHGEALAHLLPDRVITYRRFWSRIERAAARLQGEWGIQPDDTVAYIGNGHPDAIVLYCALMRLGALLLPLEGYALAQAQLVMQQANVKLVVHDDDIKIEGMPAHPLSLMLADWCHFDPFILQEDEQRPSLLIPQKNGNVQALLKTSVRQFLQMPASDVRANPFADDKADHAGVLVGRSVFDVSTFAGIIVPALLAVQPMRFAVIEECLDKRLRKAS